MQLYQSQCPECFLHAGPEWGREFWTAGDTAETNNPAGGKTEYRGREKREIGKELKDKGASNHRKVVLH